MTFVDDLRNGEKIYMIPRKPNVKEEDIIKIKLTGMVARLEIDFPHDKYQVISDKTLEDLTLKEYIE